MEGRDLTGRGRHVLRPFQVVCGTRLRMRHMGGQCPQERWTFRHDAPPCMPVPVEASLVSFGVPKPTRQSEVLLEAWSCVSPHKESCGHAGHPPSHVAGKRGGRGQRMPLASACIGPGAPWPHCAHLSAGPRHARSLAPAAGRRGVLPAPWPRRGRYRRPSAGGECAHGRHGWYRGDVGAKPGRLPRPPPCVSPAVGTAHPDRH
jgi:hypothetical protein